MKRIMILLVVATLTIPIRGQGFLNLDFESAQNVTNNPGFNGEAVAVTNALPYWAAYDGRNALSEIYYVTNNPPPGISTAVELEGGSAALSGKWSVGLWADASITQTGLVPGNAESLQFGAYGSGAGGSLGGTGFGVSLGGQDLSFSVLSESANYWTYGANIPAGMDGQMEPLTFFTPGGGVLLDNIGFRPTSVPEPAEFALISLGVILFALFRRRFAANDLTKCARSDGGHNLLGRVFKISL